MGLFDKVLTDISCRNCGQLIRAFQTKAFEHKGLRTIELGKDIRKEIPECRNHMTFPFHSFCNHCGYWHDAHGVVVDGVFTEIIEVKMGDKVYDFEERGLKKE